MQTGSCGSSGNEARTVVALGNPGVERQQRLGRGPVCAVDEESPVQATAERAEAITQRGHARVVVLAVLLGARHDVAEAGFRILELGAARVGKGLFDWIDDLDKMRPRADP